MSAAERLGSGERQQRVDCPRSPSAVHLIFLIQCPRLDAAFAQITRKLGCETMKGEYALGRTSST
jgi:hypothetical protein